MSAYAQRHKSLGVATVKLQYESVRGLIGKFILDERVEQLMTVQNFNTLAGGVLILGGGIPDIRKYIFNIYSKRETTVKSN